MKNKVAFITGGATGIGKATAEAFLAAGYKVGILDSNHSAETTFASFIESGQAKVYIGDVRDSDFQSHALESTANRFGTLSTLFANAGIHRTNTVQDISNTSLDELIDVNVKGLVYSVRAAVPHLIGNGCGSIVLMGSDQCFIGKKSNFAYGLTKGAIGQMTKSLALDLAEHQIRVTCVCPGPIRTPLGEAAVEQLAAHAFDNDLSKAWAAVAAKQPVGRVGEPEEVASLVLFLASDDARFITGSLHLVDGGLCAG